MRSRCVRSFLWCAGGFLANLNQTPCINESVQPSCTCSLCYCTCSLCYGSSRKALLLSKVPLVSNVLWCVESSPDCSNSPWNTLAAWLTPLLPQLLVPFPGQPESLAFVLLSLFKRKIIAMELQLQVYLDTAVQGLAIKDKKKNFAFLLLCIFNLLKTSALLQV